MVICLMKAKNNIQSAAGSNETGIKESFVSMFGYQKTNFLKRTCDKQYCIRKYPFYDEI